MTIPTDTALWLQEQMLGLYHEDWGLVYMTGGNLASIPFNTPIRWQLGVDLIYRGPIRDLIKVKDYGATPDRASFLQAIRTLNPWGDGAGFWHATLVWDAPRLDKLIEAHFPSPDQHEGKLNPCFHRGARVNLCRERRPLVRHAAAADHSQRGQLGSSRSALIEARQPPLKDQYDEWLARIICYAFSVPVSPFVSQVNRATGETMRQQATQEGLVPLKAWVKNALDHVIQVCMNEPGLEFIWVGDDAVDPLEQAQTLQILVGAGMKTREEARADLGLAPAGGCDRSPSAGFRTHYWGSSIRITTSAVSSPAPTILLRERRLA